MISLRVEAGLYLAGILLAEYASPWRLQGRTVSLVLAAVLTARFVGQSVRRIHLTARFWPVLRGRFIELGLSAAALLLLVSKAAVWSHQLIEPGTRAALDPIYRQYTLMFVLVAGIRLVVGDVPVRRVLHRLELQPAQTVALGFASAIFVGTLLLSLPIAVNRIEDVSLLDALFTATSAVTVSGLIVYDPGTFHTAFGQWALLGLIQLGGVGTMAASASLVVLAGRRLRLRSAAALRESMDLETIGQVRGQIVTIIAITLVAEGLGALVLYGLWTGDPGVDSAGFAALFHAVSAFCNAGFSTFSTGLQPFRDAVGTNAVVAVLIVLGGLGFPVLRLLSVLRHRVRAPGRGLRLSLHARLTLATTGALLVVGALAGLVLEWSGTLAGLAWPSRMMTAAFLSVTARTAGFTTLDTGALAPATLWLLMLLMFVGGSPGSTAGGIKTTTFGTVVATLWATLRGRPRVEAFRRTIPEEQVAKALALGGIASAVVAGGVTVLLATQHGEPLALAFEAVSAFGTVGLSTGLTPSLNPAGKVVIMALMFVGRTGPLTLGYALAARRAGAPFAYPTEKIMIG